MPGDDDYQGERILVLTEWRWDRILRAAKIMKEYLQGPGKHLNVGKCLCLKRFVNGVLDGLSGNTFHLTFKVAFNFSHGANDLILRCLVS